MSVTYPPIPSRDDLLAILRAAVANAEDLLSDADLLLRAGRYPRAHALATLSWEELSKGQLCMLAAVMPGIPAEDFWIRFRDHESKLSRVHMFADFMESVPVGPVADHAKKVISDARSVQNLKLRGLYVEYRRGKVLLPSQVGERAARRRLAAVRAALDQFAAVSDPAMLDEAFAQVHPLLEGPRLAVLAEPDAMAAALQTAIQGGPQDQLQALVYKHLGTKVD
jgi:AbiV family abortive infection protein